MAGTKKGLLRTYRKHLLVAAVAAYLLWQVFTPPYIGRYSAVAESPIWITSNVFKGGGGTGGYIPGGYSSPLKSGGGGGVNLEPAPSPRKLTTEWFHLGQQRYYRAVLEDDEMPRKIWRLSWKHVRFSRYQYHLELVTAITDSGVMEAWLHGRCADRDKNKFYSFTEFLGSVQGREIPGDPKNLASQTKWSRERGEIPPVPDPAPPATQPPLPE